MSPKGRGVSRLRFAVFCRAPRVDGAGVCPFAGFCGGVTGFWGVGVGVYLVLLVRARVGRFRAFWVCKTIGDFVAAVQGVDLLRC